MPITRAKATSLLNQKEMALYDDSRANALRKLDEKAVAARIKRARDARDRSRDLVQRQKLSSRDRTGNKRGTSGQANQRSKDKAELMTDILRRFEARLKEANREQKAESKASGKTAQAKKAAKRTATSKKPAAKKKAAAKKTTRKAAKAPAKKAATKTSRASAKKATKKVSKAPAKKTATKKAAKSAGGKKAPARKKAATPKKRALTPKQALEKTRKLLEAKQQRDREPKPWETLGQGEDAIGKPGYQSTGAASRAQELHAGEVRLPAIKGSISTRDRINQGKRDHR